MKNLRKYILLSLPFILLLIIGISVMDQIRIKADKVTETEHPKEIYQASISSQPASFPKIGDQALEISQNNPEGNTIKLSSLKGKIVLLEFWASWCGPCRKENPNLVKTYLRYKNYKFKNASEFTVYSVSMDKDKNAWKQAISNDKLDWPTHVSDLKYWNNEAAIRYGVESIPANYLIDETGKIIAMNLRGVALNEALDKLAQ